LFLKDKEISLKVKPPDWEVFKFFEKLIKLYFGRRKR